VSEALPWPRATFSSLRSRTVRTYLAAQLGSCIGNWIQITAENWLVLQLTHSGLALGITNALQFGPLLIFGLYGGVIADRFDRRRLLIVTQGLLAVLSASIGLLVAVHMIQLWMIWVAAALLGVIIAVDKPALLSFVKDLAGEAELANAVALNNAVISCGRMVGPAISGVLIAAFGLPPAFLLNAASFGCVICVLLWLRDAPLHAGAPVDRKPGQVREALTCIRRDTVLALTIVSMSVVFVAAYNFQVMIPLLASRVLGGSSALFGLVMSLMGLGAVIGSLLIAARAQPGLPMIAACCSMFTAVYVWLALAVGLLFALAGMLVLGVCFGLFNVTVSGTLQLRAPDALRRRVMVTYSMGILGSGLIGAPLVGWLADVVGVARTLLIIAGVCAATGAVVSWAWLRSETRSIHRSVRRV
jgi:MFS family permease